MDLPLPVLMAFVAQLQAQVSAVMEELYLVQDAQATRIAKTGIQEL